MDCDARIIDACRLCDGSDLLSFIDFGTVPLGNDLEESQAAAIAASSYRLEVLRCATCGHFQLGCAVDPQLLYATNYTYLSGIGFSFLSHFDSYVDWVQKHCNLQAGGVVVDIGSNDGTCLERFQNRGFSVIGVDPASLAAGIANEKGINTINTFFDFEAVDAIKRRLGPADFVTSHNVLAHVDDLRSVFLNVYELLKDEGYFAFEVGYFLEVLRKGNFDTIYHEHLDYHHAQPLVAYLTNIGFDIVDLSVNSVQGGSIRLLLKKTGNGKISDAAKLFLETEHKSELYNNEYLIAWAIKIKNNMENFRNLLHSRRNAGLVIVAYGAPTKATLLMKMAGLTSDDIAYVVEDNPYKTDRFLPTSGIPIKLTSELDKNIPDVIVLFAWNFADDIVSKLTNRFSRPLEVVIPQPILRTVML